MQAQPITKTFTTPEKTSPYPDTVPPPSEQDNSNNIKDNITSSNSKEKSPSKSKEECTLNYPSFSQYINPQRLKPYDEMLKKNIRSFNTISNKEKEKKIKEENIEQNMKEKYSTDVPIIEINFKFTCDYELIESELKEFLELFGEINSLNYDMNLNALKVVYKYHFSSMYANYYLNHLIYENNKKNKYGNYLLFTKKDQDEQQDKKSNTSLNEKQSEDIFKFIKFLTENYKSEHKMKLNETPIKSAEAKYNNKLNNNNNNESSTKNKKEEIEQESEIKSEFSSIEKNDINSEKKIYSNIINNPKNLNLLQNSETPIKKSNVFNNYSDNNINSTTKNMKNNKGGSNLSATPLNPFNSALTPPFLYMPFAPKMNMKLGIPIPILFPFDSSFLKKKFAENKSNQNSRKEVKASQRNSSSIELNQKENKINSCLMEQGNNNPINSINPKIESENSQSQNDNQIKEIFDNINNKIANISNNSNDSTNSNEKNNNNNVINDNDNESSSNNKSNSELNSSNKNSSEKSDSTIKTEKVNKSNNATDELNRIIDIKSLEEINANKSINSNGNSNSNNENKSGNNKSSSGNSSGFMSSFKGKTLSLERLNNYLQENKPVSNFANPISFLSENTKTEISQKEEEKIEDKKDKDEKNKIQEKEKEISPNSKKNCQSPNSNLYGYNETNNYFNPMYNFLYIPTLFPEGLQKNQKNGKMFPVLPFPCPPPPNFQNLFFKNNPINFDKDVIDFNKLTLETKNKVHFMTHSSRNYYYKYVCNYTVQIENDNLFMVTKRIIGKNGCFLKKILQESCIKYGDYSTKIRLRGKGSGYVDKISNNESTEEPLMLSVSSLNYPTYINCCLLIDNLMNKIYDDYYDHLHKVLPKELHYSIIKKKLIKNEFIVDRVSSMPFNNFANNINVDDYDINKSKSDININIKNGNENKKEEKEDNKDKDAN